jgi:hypothetical protein
MPARKKEPPSLPTTFQEHHRNYTLDIFTEGRLGSGTSSAEGCLQTVTFLPDGGQFVLVAKYRDTEIGRGTYRKYGDFGQVTTAETVEAEGALIGLIEAALAKREESRQAALQKERAERLIPLPCPSCSSALGYDPQDQLFARSSGEVVLTCDHCGDLLDLEQIRLRYQQRIRQLRTDLAHAEEALHQVEHLKRQQHILSPSMERK